jgi:hypothetical protein
MWAPRLTRSQTDHGRACEPASFVVRRPVHNAGIGPSLGASSSVSGGSTFGHDFRNVRVTPEGATRAGVVKRKTTPKPPPTFAGCTPDNTLTENPNQAMATAITFAADLVDAARAAIERDDKSETYRTALARHFINPSFGELKDIYKSLHRIWFQLKPENFGCAASDADMDECEKVTQGGFDLAFTTTSSGVAIGKSIVCPAFGFERLPCQAITLIHESAHRVGIGNGGPHPPNRGDAGYPTLAGAPPAGQTTALRVDNPDAYGHFAAHIGRETDTDCNTSGVGAPISPRGAIKIEGKAPPGPSKK